MLIRIFVKKYGSYIVMKMIERKALQGRSNRVLLMLHGYGANKEDLFSMSDVMDPTLHIISIEAPISLGYGGYAWFPIDFLPDGIKVDEEAAQHSLAALLKTVEAIKEQLQPEQLFMLGFSQGTIMSFGVALHRPELISGVIGFSGRLTDNFIPQKPNYPAYRKLPIFQTHGVMDPVIPVLLGRKAHEKLQGFGFLTTYKEYSFAHEISMGCLQDAIHWLNGHLK